LPNKLALSFGHEEEADCRRYPAAQDASCDSDSGQANRGLSSYHEPCLSSVNSYPASLSWEPHEREWADPHWRTRHQAMYPCA